MLLVTEEQSPDKLEWIANKSSGYKKLDGHLSALFAEDTLVVVYRKESELLADFFSHCIDESDLVAAAVIKGKIVRSDD